LFDKIILLLLFGLAIIRLRITELAVRIVLLPKFA